MEHYENMPMQYTEKFYGCKNGNFNLKIMILFFIFAQNIDREYTLEPPCRGGSNENLQPMFWTKNKKNRYTPSIPQFYYIKEGLKGVFIART